MLFICHERERKIMLLVFLQGLVYRMRRYRECPASLTSIINNIISHLYNSQLLYNTGSIEPLVVRSLIQRYICKSKINVSHFFELMQQMCTLEQFDNKLLILFYYFKVKPWVSTAANRINILVCSFEDLAEIVKTCSAERNLLQSSPSQIQEDFSSTRRRQVLS